jgi:hypothetical protein
MWQSDWITFQGNNQKCVGCSSAARGNDRNGLGDLLFDLHI